MAGLGLKLVVGLGNPGAEYARTRHNAGWWFVDALADQYRGSWRADARAKTETSRIEIDGHDLWLVKPTAFMNRSGAPVQSVASFYRIQPAEILVAHDELDLPVGTARLKEAGGHGGHNGLRDLIAVLGAEFWRLRLGIAHPGARDEVIDYVLQRPDREDERLIEEAIGRALQVFPKLLGAGAQKAMNELHGAAGAAKGSNS